MIGWYNNPLSTRGLHVLWGFIRCQNGGISAPCAWRLTGPGKHDFKIDRGPNSETFHNSLFFGQYFYSNPILLLSVRNICIIYLLYLNKLNNRCVFYYINIYNVIDCISIRKSRVHTNLVIRSQARALK